MKLHIYKLEDDAGKCHGYRYRFRFRNLTVTGDKFYSNRSSAIHAARRASSYFVNHKCTIIDEVRYNPEFIV